MSFQQYGGIKRICKHQDVVTRAGNANADQLPASGERWSFIAIEVQRTAVRIVEHNDTIELFPLRLVNGHYMDTTQIVTAR